MRVMAGQPGVAQAVDSAFITSIQSTGVLDACGDRWDRWDRWGRWDRYLSCFSFDPPSRILPFLAPVLWTIYMLAVRAKLNRAVRVLALPEISFGWGYPEFRPDIDLPPRTGVAIARAIQPLFGVMLPNKHSTKLTSWVLPPNVDAPNAATLLSPILFFQEGPIVIPAKGALFIGE